LNFYSISFPVNHGNWLKIYLIIMCGKM